jgi:hypothetical protein
MEYNPDFNFEGDRIATSRPVITRRYGSAANQDGADLFVSFGRLLILLVLASDHRRRLFAFSPTV